MAKRLDIGGCRSVLGQQITIENVAGSVDPEHCRVVDNFDDRSYRCGIRDWDDDRDPIRDVARADANE